MYHKVKSSKLFRLVCKAFLCYVEDCIYHIILLKVGIDDINHANFKWIQITLIWNLFIHVTVKPLY